ncbi:MAG TPA: xanthine dehydrogenase family protein molybdopterin-binding subunit [Thermoanaerobaculia bacterium]|nr:xanthine dehydrogenase family protein molybdopterin-binding subunit [Thermoanaerobaculia bacterium]
MSALSRRAFLTRSAMAGGGLVIGLSLPGPVRRLFAQEAPTAAKKIVPNAFIRIAPDDTVTILLKHSEMGQGIYTSLPMVVAEELECDWSKVRSEHAPADLAYAHTVFGIQMTGGSTSTWESFDQLRTAGAAAREMLIAAAAARWGVPAGECRAENGFVIHGERRARFGELAEAAAELPVPEAPKLKDPKDWKIIGRPTRRLDSPAKITGKAEFGMDVRRPGMLVALVARSPVFGGKAKSFRAGKAKAVPGVVDVIEIPSGIAVLGEHFWAARLGRDVLEVDWEPGSFAGHSTTAQREDFHDRVRTDGTVAATKGDVKAAFGRAVQEVEAEYEVPYLSHAMMEPLNCTAEVRPDACEIWTGTQFQTGDQAAAAQIAGLKPEQVHVHTTFLGGGFGRRANPRSDFVSEAVHLAKAAGRPVKVVWTREDDLRGGYYRPMWVSRLRAGLDSEGKPIAWSHTVVGQSILAGSPFASMIKNGVDETSVEGAADSPYLAAVADHRVDLHSPDLPIPVLWWRSVGHSHTAFVVESFIDELAHAAKKDPVAFRRELLPEGSRHRRVLDSAAEAFGWGKPLPAGHGAGIAVHESFGSVVAQAAEVSVDQGRIRVHRVVCAIDCGPVVNPAGVEAQMQSGIVYGLSAALYGEITFRDGRVEQSNFHDYPVLRMSEMPKVEVHIARSTEKMGGAGEPGTPPIAPAVANALFAVTGKRLRQLPLRLA